jgi:neurotransmitter:Na+ symporter, NSS family
MTEAETPTQSRAQFGSRIGFILAAIGSAVGFGSIARFPMNVANNGGAVFVVLYLLLMVLVGIPMMVSEFSLGRSAQKNTVGVYASLTENPKSRWRAAGYFHWILAAFFLSWYAVVSGWTLRYVFASASGSYFGDAAGIAAFKLSVLEGPQTLFWHLVVLLLTLGAVLGNISKGIERINFILMPLLFAMIIGLAIYASTLSNVTDGYAFYLRPDFSALNIGVVTAAVGQAFFSLSLGQGAMMTYASYLPRTTSLASNAAMISFSTLIFALISGFLIFPLLSSFGDLQADATASGLDLIFGPLAKVFSAMGQPTGQIIGTIFFLATFFAAFTSAISLTEPAIAYFVEERGIDRKRAAILVVVGIYTLGIIFAFSNTLLGLAGGKLTDVSVIGGGLIIALYVGWFSPRAKAIARIDESDGGLKLSWYVYPLVRYFLPALLGVLLFFAVFGSPCFLTGGADGTGLIKEFFKPMGYSGWDCVPSA